jgi:benzoate membrane transport protein
MPAKPIITTTSIASLAVACVGGITIVLASITAALCMGKDAHELKKSVISQALLTAFSIF